MSDRFGLIFDVDGVIADTEKVNAEASIKVLGEMFGLGGVKREDFEKGLGRGAGAYIMAAADVHGFRMTSDQVVAATVARQREFLAMLEAQPLPPLPGVVELMNAALARDDFRVAIATSSTREKSEAVLESARVPYQDMVYITGSEVRNKKPDPELFLTAAREMGMPAENCVVVEDAPDGVAAAHAAGCRCIAVTNSTKADNLAAADRVVGSLLEVGIVDIVRLVRRDGSE